MKAQFKKMRNYNQRRSSKEIREIKFELKNLSSTIKENAISLIQCIEEGSTEKSYVFSKKTKEDLDQLGPKMEKIASQIGIPFPKIVHSLLDSLEKIVTTHEKTPPSPFYSSVDRGKIRSCQIEITRLDKALRNRGAA